MITRVNTVLVANTTCPSSFTAVESLTEGQAALFNENKQIIKSEAEAAAANAIYVGVCQGTMKVVNPTSGALEDKKMIEYSNKIEKDAYFNYTVNDYEAPAAEKIEIDLTNATIVIGHRYVLRIVYKDLYEAPGQFTHTYDVIAATETPQDLCDAFAKQINRHPNRRITVNPASNKLVLTAMEKDDNEGVNSINEYSIVSMEASLYTTVPGALLSNQPEAVPGATIEKTAGKAGKGYWKQVRDAEMRNMGYKGHVFTGAYPEVEQDKKVNPANTYDTLVIENDNKYLSPDNQYVKSTPLTTTLFVKAGTLTGTNFIKFVKAFATGQASE